MTDAGLRRIWLCADDYGISPGVNRAIRELLAQGRVNATSVMLVGPAIGRDDATALQQAVAERPRAAIGLHVTLTAPFYPLSMHFRPLDGGMFLPLARKLQASILMRYDREIVRAEIAAQLTAFKELFGHPPAYVDGHQHVQLFPQIRDAFLTAVKHAAPHAWVRQCGRSQSLGRRIGQPKALLLDTLSVQFRARARRDGIAFNPGFAGAYDFTRRSDFDGHMQAFLDDLPDGGLIMCHPGYVDPTLAALDPLTDQREREYAYLASDAFPRLLSAAQASLD